MAYQNKTRRALLVGLLGAGETLIAKVPRYVVPRWFIKDRRLRAIKDPRDLGVSGEQVWLQGQDGRKYSLSDVIAGIFKVGIKYGK